MADYDELSMVYDAWCQADMACKPSLSFYINFIKKISSPILELGIGTGRIALELAKESKNVIGIDCSDSMLRICKAEAKRRHLEQYLKLFKADMRNFDLDQPVTLAYLPFRTFGHLLTREDRLSMLSSVFRNLEPNGRFVFDHYVFNPSWAKENHGKSRLMCVIPGSEKGESYYVYDIYLYDFEKELMDCRIVIEHGDKLGCVVSKKYIQFYFSWINPEEVKRLALESGFTIDNLYGSFELNEWNDQSHEQIWVLSKKQ